MIPKNVKKVVNHIVEHGGPGGLSGMTQLPKTIEKMKKLGVDGIVDRQQLRSITGLFNDRSYIAFLLSRQEGEIWGLWETRHRENRYGGTFAKFIWKGWAVA